MKIIIVLSDIFINFALQKKIDMLFQSQITYLKRMSPFWRRRKIKSEMRALISQKRRILTEEEVNRLSQDILRQVEELPEWRSAKTVLVYYPVQGEVNTRPLLEAWKDTKTMLLPVAHRRTMEMRQYVGRKDLKKGRFGIPEPQTPAYTGSVDLIIVPGVAFDRQRRRLGRGGGYYDRFLKQYKHIPHVAVAYDFQIVKEVPVTWFDRRVTCIVTPTEIIR